MERGKIDRGNREQREIGTEGDRDRRRQRERETERGEIVTREIEINRYRETERYRQTVRETDSDSEVQISRKIRMVT
jgi:hypothetical protein